jgi:hypothetical protein
MKFLVTPYSMVYVLQQVSETSDQMSKTVHQLSNNRRKTYNQYIMILKLVLFVTVLLNMLGVDS